MVDPEDLEFVRALVRIGQLGEHFKLVGGSFGNIFNMFVEAARSVEGYTKEPGGRVGFQDPAVTCDLW